MALDEPEEDNPAAARHRAETAALIAEGIPEKAAQRRAGSRVFGSKPGAYGAGLQAMIDEKIWHDRAEPEQVAVLDLCIDQRPVPLPQAMGEGGQGDLGAAAGGGEHAFAEEHPADGNAIDAADQAPVVVGLHAVGMAEPVQRHVGVAHGRGDPGAALRSEEHTSELQSLMRISYAVFCLQKKKKQHSTRITHTNIRVTKKY